MERTFDRLDQLKIWIWLYQKVVFVIFEAWVFGLLWKVSSALLGDTRNLPESLKVILLWKAAHFLVTPFDKDPSVIAYAFTCLAKPEEDWTEFLPWKSIPWAAVEIWSTAGWDRPGKVSTKKYGQTRHCKTTGESWRSVGVRTTCEKREVWVGKQKAKILEIRGSGERQCRQGRDGGAARHSSRRDSLKSPRGAGSAEEKQVQACRRHHRSLELRASRESRKDEDSCTHRLGTNGVRTQAERIHSQRLKPRSETGVKGEPSTGEGSDSNLTSNMSMHRM